MKTKLTALLLTVVATVLLAQVPPPPATPPAPADKGKAKAISVPLRTFNPGAPSNVSAVTNTTSGAPTRPPSTVAPELLPALPLPAGTAAPATSAPAAPRNVLALPGGSSAAGRTNVMGSLPAGAATAGVNAAGEVLLDPSFTSFKEMPLGQVLEIYSELTGRTVLRSPSVQPTLQITLVTKTPLTVRETIQAIDGILALNSIVVIATGEKFLTVVPSAGALQEAAAFNQMDTKDLPEASQYITKVVQIKNAKPSEIVPAIQPFAKVPGGILPIDATGILVLRDNAINIKRMMEILEKIDVTVPLDEKFEVIPIRYALVGEVASVLGSLTSAGPIAGASSRTGSSSTRRTGNTSPFGPTTGQPGATGATGTTPFGTQPGVNTGIPGTATPGSAQGAFQNRLNQIVSNITGGRTGSTPLLGEAKIIPYERSNAILVLASEQELKMVRVLVEKLDTVQQQVLIEAIIMEVTLNDNFELGLSVGQKSGVPTAANRFFGGSRTSFGGGTQNFASSLISGAVTNLPAGFSYYALLGQNWDLALNAAAGDGTVNVLSRPRIQTSHAEAASLLIGDTVPYITGTQQGFNGNPISQYSQQFVGITLNVLPLINPEGLVVLDIKQVIDQLGVDKIIDGNPVPTTSKREASAKVAVRSGEAIILGGFITTTKTMSKGGVPYLKDIPGLGLLFSNRKEDKRRVELIVMIRPVVLPTPEAASVAAMDIKSKLPGISRAERENEREERERHDKAELEELRKLMKKYPRGPIPPPEPSLLNLPVPVTEKKESNDFLEIPKPGTP